MKLSSILLYWHVAMLRTCDVAKLAMTLVASAFCFGWQIEWLGLLRSCTLAALPVLLSLLALTIPMAYYLSIKLIKELTNTPNEIKRTIDMVGPMANGKWQMAKQRFTKLQILITRSPKVLCRICRICRIWRRCFKIQEMATLTSKGFASVAFLT